ncbi:MAG: MFS transporter [Actinoplanes sp.]
MSQDFRRLWAAYSVSELGTALSLGALPLIATLVLHASVLQVSLLAALGGVAGAALALPLGPWIEVRRKRPVMIGADLLRGAALASLPAAALLGRLSYSQLCLVAMAQSVGAIAFQAAGGAHLKALVPPEQRAAANGRFEATFWTANTAGPPLGGVLIALLGATATVGLDALSFLLSALGIRRLRSPEPPPPPPTGERHRLAQLTAGWRYVLGHRQLRALFGNTLLFGGGVMAAMPLMTVLMLRDLALTPWQYGLSFGLSCLGGLLGALAAPPLTRRFGERRVLLTSGVAKTLPFVLVPLAPPGVTGLVFITVGQFLLIGGAGTFNPTFATYRMRETEDAYMSRVTASWSISTRTIQPICITAGGFLAAATSARTALFVVAAVVLASALPLPWRARAPALSATAG